jgi:hypothetical protein
MKFWIDGVASREVMGLQLVGGEEKGVGGEEKQGS